MSSSWNCQRRALSSATTKAVSELFCPLAGEVVDVNPRLDGEPALVNSDPYGEGWMIRLRLKNADDKKSLLSADAYSKQIG